jgi:hypothetical protein
MTYKVHYQAGSYSGHIHVNAENECEANEKAQRQIQREMTLPMYSMSTRVVDSDDEGDDS